MKLTIVLLTAAFLNVSGKGLSQSVSLSGNDILLKKVFHEVEKQTGYVVTYTNNTLNNTRPVSIDVRNIPLEMFLKQVLKDQPVEYIIENKTILLFRKPLALVSAPESDLSVIFTPPPPIEIRGRVADPLGAPMSGVSVTLKGSSTGVSTGEDGRFSISVPSELPEKILVFSYVDHQTQEVRITNQTTINITLQPTKRSLNEIVVVGYSAQRRENITGSVGYVGAEQLTDAVSPNVSSLLQGKVAGVDIVGAGGRPGRTANITIRGRSSISTSQVPIWVVDGVIMHEDPNLNPNDVESISVLKDAAAASLYGARAANGVIVVTTKIAKGVDKKELQVFSRLSISKFNMGNFELMNSQDLVDLYKSFGNPASIPSWFNESLANVNTDWVGLGTHNGLGQEYQVGYSGTTGKARMYSALNYYKDEGAVKGYSFERWSGRMNVDYQLNDKITFSPKLSATYSKAVRRMANTFRMFTNLPWDRAYDDDGKVIDPTVGPSVTWYGRDRENAFHEGEFNLGVPYDPLSGKQDNFNIIGNFDFKYQITKNFAFKSTNNLTYNHSLAFTYIDPRSAPGRALRGQIFNTTGQRLTRFTNQMITYSGKTGKHEINALAAYEYNDFRLNTFSTSGTGIVPGIMVLDGAATPVSSRGNITEYAFRSYLFNANYGFDDNRFVGQFSFRRDGSSRFGSNNLYGNFWSVSGGWNIHRESFFNSNSINYLRLKAAYGGVGNTPNDFYPQYDIYSVNAQYNGTPSALPTALGNPDLTWEKTYSTNVGVDMGLFNRIDLSVEFYDKNTSDLLYLVPLPAVFGYTGKFENIGAVSNKGIEVSIGADIVKSNNFNWRLDFNIGAYRNRIKELYRGNSQIAGSFIYTEGQDINTWYRRKWAGVNPENGDPQWEVVNPTTKEVTLTNVYSAATLQTAGTTTPDFYGGIATNMSYKGLSLRANFAYRQGSLIDDILMGSYDSDGAFPTYNQKRLNKGESRWSTDNPNATHPLPMYGGNRSAHSPSTRSLKSGSFFRMRNITLSYSLPESLLSRMKVKGLTVFASGDNLLTITPFDGVDPEIVSNIDTTAVFGFAYNPTPKMYTFGVNVRL